MELQARITLSTDGRPMTGNVFCTW